MERDAATKTVLANGHARVAKVPAKKKATKSTHAPGQALGFSLQYTQFTHLLLTAPEGSLVSFEVFEDVGMETADGGKVYVQSKSALTANPIADHAVSFWKTLANWTDALAVEPHEISKLKLVLYVSRPVDGDIASSFVAANTLEAAAEAIKKAKKQFSSKGKVSAELKPYLDRFFQAKSEIAATVVAVFEIQCGSGSPSEDLSKAVARQWIPPEKVNVVLNQACGWVKGKVDRLLEQQKPAILSRDEFTREMTAFARKVVERSILHSFAPSPTPEEQEAHKLKTFVRQLQLVEAEFDDQMEAISNFFRATRDRVQWATSGEIHRSSLDDLDKNLLTTWKNLRLITTVEGKNLTTVDSGRVLLAKCMLHVTDVERLHTPAHFIPGCFHLLADNLDIGWHPDYMDALKKPTSEDQP